MSAQADFATRVVALFALASLCLLLLLYAYLLTSKWRRNGRRRRTAAWAAQAALPDSPVERYVTAGETSRRLAPRQPWQWQALEAYLARRLRAGGSEAERERVCRLAGELFAPLYRSRLHDRRAPARLHAIAHIELFRMKELQHEVAAILAGIRIADKELWAALRALAALQHPRVPAWLLGAEGPLPVASEHRYRQVLLALDDGLLEALADRFDEADAALQINLLDVLRARNVRTERTLALFERLMRAPSAELRVRALKAAANFGYLSPEAEEALLERYRNWRDAPWPERLMAEIGRAHV